MKRIAIIVALAIGLGGCAGFGAKVQQFSQEYQTTIAAVNADIAATSPLIAKTCVDIQKYASLIIPFLPTNGKAPQYISAANSAITAYCQVIPTDIPTTAAAVTAAYKAAVAGYNNVSTGG